MLCPQVKLSFWGSLSNHSALLKGEGVISYTLMREPLLSRTIEGALLNMSADKPVSVACKRCFYFSIRVMFKRVIFSQKNYKID